MYDSIAGVAGTGAAGVEALSLSITESGVAGTGAIGTEVPEASITETGVAGTGAVGTATTITQNIVELFLSGATSSLGTATVDAEARVTITGVSATSELSNLNVWGLIDESQTPNWTDVAA